MDFASFEKKELTAFEPVLLSQLEKTETKGSLYEAMCYSIKAGGKRIRPLLLLATIQSLGGETKRGYEIAAALEFVHTYSLIHDDLPAMDNDDLRRGKPTNHVVFGEDMAILAGDALLTQAFYILAHTQIHEKKKIELISALAMAAGPNGMVVGQVKDLEGETKSLTLKELKAVHEKKTGELLKFAVFAGALIADAPAEIKKALIDYAAHFGLAFQIRDDILDVIGTASDLGKNPGVDETRNKSTYPALLSLDGAKLALKNELVAAKENLAYIEVMYQKNREAADIHLLSEMIDLLVVD